jgi:pimeloyl-ACP methyl ester carboxylesterase
VADHLHTTEYGETGPRLLFLHGLFGQGRNWTQIAKVLADRHRVTLVDLPDHGRSAWLERFDLVEVADRIAGLVSADDPVALVGHSLGGKVAMVLALRHPELVERLVLFGTYAHGETAFPNRELRESLLGIMRSHHGVGSRLFAEFYRPGASPDAAEHLTRVLRDSAPPDVAADYLEATYSADVRGHLPGVHCPALVLHYRDDKVIPFAGGEQLAAGLPDVRFVALDGGFHLPDVHDLDPVVDAVIRFAGHATTVRHDVEEGSSA